LVSAMQHNGAGGQLLNRAVWLDQASGIDGKSRKQTIAGKGLVEAGEFVDRRSCHLTVPKLAEPLNRSAGAAAPSQGLMRGAATWLHYIVTVSTAWRRPTIMQSA